MQEAEGKWGEQQAVLQREVSSLEHRLRSLETQNSELQAAASEGLQPLLRWEGRHAAQAVVNVCQGCCTTPSSRQQSLRECSP